jgi:hypothetical protein
MFVSEEVRKEMDNHWHYITTLHILVQWVALYHEAPDHVTYFSDDAKTIFSPRVSLLPSARLNSYPEPEMPA